MFSPPGRLTIGDFDASAVAAAATRATHHIRKDESTVDAKTTTTNRIEQTHDEVARGPTCRCCSRSRRQLASAFRRACFDPTCSCYAKCNANKTMTQRNECEQDCLEGMASCSKPGTVGHSTSSAAPIGAAIAFAFALDQHRRHTTPTKRFDGHVPGANGNVR